MLDYSVNYENTKPCVLTHQSVNFGKQLRLTQQQQSDNVLEVQGYDCQSLKRTQISL